MRSIATIKLKIPKNEILLDTMKQYSEAVSYIVDMGYKAKIHKRYDLHHLCYYKARRRFNLPSQFVINANRVASQTLKSAKTNKGSKPVFKENIPLAFDRRTFTFSKDNVRLTTIGGRINIPVKVPEYYTKYLGWRYQTALLILDRKGRMFLNITFSREINTKRSGNGRIVGVDVGVNNLAVTSDGKFFKGCKTKIMQFRYLRRILQAKGTKSAKRLLRKVSGGQKRYMAWVNHNVSKDIVNNADTIVLENLKGIRRTKNKYKGKRLNRWLNSWSFYQLQRFIKYKAEREGKRVVFVNPYMTSQTCSDCGKLGSRYFDSFSCSHCGLSNYNSDLNAGRNLAHPMLVERQVAVTPPYSRVDEHKSISHYATVCEIMAKSPHL